MLKQVASLPAGVSRYSPAGLASGGSEHGEQAALFCWVNMAHWLGVDAADDAATYTPKSIYRVRLQDRMHSNTPLIPELGWLHAIPNGGARNAASAGIMKAEGVKPGIADMFWPVPRGVFHGLYMEMKRRNGVASDVTDQQRLFEGFVTLQGYRWVWTRGWIDARNVLIDYARNEAVIGV